MKPSSFRTISALRDLRVKQSSHQESESVWNLFVQLLLPLVLIVTFIAVLDVVRYKVVAEESIKDSNNWITILEELDPEKLVHQQQRLIIELQRQKLINALQQFRIQEEQALRLAKFIRGGNDIQLDGVTVVDEDFKHLCITVKRKAVDQESNYLNAIYRRILDLAELSDPGQHQYRIRRRSENDSRRSTRSHPITEGRVVSKQNRFFIHNRIIEYVHDLKETVVTIQSEVLIRLYHELIKHPGEIDKRSSELVRCMLTDPSEARKDECSESFYHRTMKRVKTQIKSYNFLDQTWDQIATLKR